MFDLDRRGPACQPVNRDTLHLTPLPGYGIVKMQLRGAAPATINGILTSLPATGASGAVGSVAVAGIAPGDWLLIGDEPATAALAARCADALGDTLHLLTDLGHARAAFRLEGSGARSALATLCPLDLSDPLFPAGSSARSLLGEAALFVLRLDEGFLIIVDQTMAAYASRLIAAA